MMSTETREFFWFRRKLRKSGQIDLVANTELLKIILQPIKIFPSFNLNGGFNLDDGFETASCRRTNRTLFEIFCLFWKLKFRTALFISNFMSEDIF